MRSRQVFSKLMRSLAERRFTITSEVEPTKTASLEGVIEAARTLKNRVTAVNITDCPAGLAYMSPLVPAIVIQREVGLEVVYQVTCRDRNRIAIFGDLLAASAAGIRNILALTGDHPALGDLPKTKPVFDLDSQQLVYMIRKMVDEGVDLAGNRIEPPPKFHVGVAAAPAAEPLEPEIIKLERKVKIGAEFVQTQAVYDIEIAKRFLGETRHLDIPILIGVCPPRSYGMAKWMVANLPGIVIPDELMERFRRAEARGKEALFQENVEIFSELVRELRRTTEVAGVHIMAPGYEGVVPEVVRRAA